MANRNPYAVLGLPLDASTDAIKAAWRRLARQHHPDVTSGDPAGDNVMERRATRRMAEINAAYHELRDPERRRVHREAAAREARADDGGEWRNAAAPGRAPTASPAHDHTPRPRRERPVTARIDTSALFRPRNAVLEPLERSPLPGQPPRPRTTHYTEPPRASTPSGPTHTRPGPSLEAELPTLAEALNTGLRFGKFEGLTLGDVVELEPTYIDWIVRTIGRDPGLVLAARVVRRFLERSGAIRRRRWDTQVYRG
jgi:curved DNA-binding protein CbpA